MYIHIHISLIILLFILSTCGITWGDITNYWFFIAMYMLIIIYYFIISGIKKFTNSVMFDCGYWPDKSGFDPSDETSMYTAGQNVIFATGRYYTCLIILNLQNKNRYIIWLQTLVQYILKPLRVYKFMYILWKCCFVVLIIVISILGFLCIFKSLRL